MKFHASGSVGASAAGDSLVQTTFKACIQAVAGLAVVLGAAAAPSVAAAADEPWVVVEGGEGPGKGKHVVLVTGDDEYRSEEMLPQLAQILAKQHGFKCTVLFPIDEKTGEVNPAYQKNIPGLQALQSADLLILFTRFRNLPDDQMKEFEEYLESGRPILGLRTSTHAFNGLTEKYKKYSWGNKGGEWDGGFGRAVFGETWISHHGAHKSQSTRGMFAPGKADSPLLRGIKDGEVWGPTDVYGVRLPQPEGCDPLLLGAVLTGMKETDPPVDGPKNNPMMPVAWTKGWKTPSGQNSRIFCTTMGCSQDFENEAFRRLLVNATYWGLKMEEKLPAKASVEIVGEYKPSPYGFNGFQKGKKPQDFFK